MKVTRLLLSAATAMAFCVPSYAQQPQTGYHTVACFKVKPENAADYRKFSDDTVRKVAQGRVDTGQITTWYLLRSVVPQGTSADCDYLIVALFPAMPHMLNPEDLSAAIKKAGLSITAEDYVAKRNALSTLVSANVFQNLDFVGTPKKGDYFIVNYMKVPGDVSEWSAYEKKIWKPFAEQMTKDGVTDGWSLNVQVMPRGTDLPYDAVTVDVVPSWDAIFAGDPHFAERFHKVHPDMELGTTLEQFAKYRTIVSTKVFALEDVITSAK